MNSQGYSTSKQSQSQQYYRTDSQPLNQIPKSNSQSSQSPNTSHVENHMNKRSRNQNFKATSQKLRSLQNQKFSSKNKENDVTYLHELNKSAPALPQSRQYKSLPYSPQVYSSLSEVKEDSNEHVSSQSRKESKLRQEQGYDQGYDLGYEQGNGGRPQQRNTARKSIKRALLGPLEKDSENELEPIEEEKEERSYLEAQRLRNPQRSQRVKQSKNNYKNEGKGNRGLKNKVDKRSKKIGKRKEKMGCVRLTSWRALNATQFTLYALALGNLGMLGVFSERTGVQEFMSFIMLVFAGNLVYTAKRALE